MDGFNSRYRTNDHDPFVSPRSSLYGPSDSKIFSPPKGNAAIDIMLSKNQNNSALQGYSSNNQSPYAIRSSQRQNDLNSSLPNMLKSNNNNPLQYFNQFDQLPQTLKSQNIGVHSSDFRASSDPTGSLNLPSGNVIPANLVQQGLPSLLGYSSSSKVFSGPLPTQSIPGVPQQQSQITQEVVPRVTVDPKTQGFVTTIEQRNRINLMEKKGKEFFDSFGTQYSNSNEFYNNLLNKGQQLTNMIENLTDVLTSCNDNYKNFNLKREKLKKDILVCENQVLSKQEIDDLQSLNSDLRIVDLLSQAIDKYSQHGNEAKNLSEYFNRQALNSQDFIDIESEFVNLYDKVLKDRAVLASNFEPFREFYKSRPNSNECQEKAHALFSGIPTHKQVYNDGWDRCNRLLPVLSEYFASQANLINIDAERYRNKVAKLKKCKFDIELAEGYEKRIFKVSKDLEDCLNVLRTLFKISESDQIPRIIKIDNYKSKLKAVQEICLKSRSEIKRVKYQVKSFGDPSSVDTHYFQVIRYKLRDKLEIEIEDVEHKIELTNNLYDVLGVIEKEEGIFRSIYDSDTFPSQRKILREADALLMDSNNMDKKQIETNVDEVIKDFNILIARYNEIVNKLRPYQENHLVSKNLHPLLRIFIDKMNIQIKSLSQKSESVFKLRFKASDIEGEITKLDIINFQNGYLTFMRRVMGNNTFMSLKDFAACSDNLVALQSTCRHKLTELDSLYSKANNPNTSRKIQDLRHNLRVIDENLRILDEGVNAAGKVSEMLFILDRNPLAVFDEHSDVQIRLKDERSYIQQVANAMIEFIKQNNTDEFLDARTICKFYVPEFNGIGDIYGNINSFFLKELPGLRSQAVNSRQDFEQSLTNFDNKIVRILGSLKEKTISNEFQKLLPIWNREALEEVASKADEQIFKSEYINLVTRALNSRSIYHLKEYQKINHEIKSLKQRYHQNRISLVLEGVLDDFEKLNINYIFGSLSVGEEVQGINADSIKVFYAKSLPEISQSIISKLARLDFTIEIIDNQKWDTWISNTKRLLDGLNTLFNSFISKLILFIEMKEQKKFTSVVHFLDSFFRLYDELAHKVTSANSIYSNLQKFEPFETQFDFISYYSANYNVDNNKQVLIGNYSNQYMKFFQFLRNQQQILKNNYKNWTDPISSACKEFESSIGSMRNEFSRFLRKGIFFNEIFTKESSCLSIIQQFLNNYTIAQQNELEKVNDLRKAAELANSQNKGTSSSQNNKQVASTSQNQVQSKQTKIYMVDVEKWIDLYLQNQEKLPYHLELEFETINFFKLLQKLLQNEKIMKDQQFQQILPQNLIDPTPLNQQHLYQVGQSQNQVYNSQPSIKRTGTGQVNPYSNFDPNKPLTPTIKSPEYDMHQAVGYDQLDFGSNNTPYIGTQGFTSMNSLGNQKQQTNQGMNVQKSQTLRSDGDSPNKRANPYKQLQMIDETDDFGMDTGSMKKGLGGNKPNYNGAGNFDFAGPSNFGQSGGYDAGYSSGRRQGL